MRQCLVRKYYFNFVFDQINATHKLSTVVLLNISVETDAFSCSLWLIESIKAQYVFEIWIFSNIVNVFTVISDHFNASMLDKSINFFSKILLS